MAHEQRRNPPPTARLRSELRQNWAVGVAKQLFNVPRQTKRKERPLTRNKHTMSIKEKEVQALASERSLGLLGLPEVQESKDGEKEEDSDDSADTVTYSPPRSAIHRSTSVQLPKRGGGGPRKTLRRASSLQPLQKGVKVGLKMLSPRTRIGGEIVKKGAVKRPVRNCLRCKARGKGGGRDSCDC